MKALLVEDNVGDVQLIRLALASSAAKVELHLADDGVKALEFLRRQGRNAGAPRPDFILMDLKLPRKSGLEVLAEIKREPALRRIPVIVLTSSSAEGDIRQAYDLQATAYFSKPVSSFEGVVASILNFMNTVHLPPEQEDTPVRPLYGVGGGMQLRGRRPGPDPGPHPREHALAAIVDSSVDPIIGVDPEGKVASWNHAAEKLFGYTEEETAGRHLRMIVPEESLGVLETALGSAVAGRATKDFDLACTGRHGGGVVVAVSASPVRERNGDVVGAALLCRDVTERRQGEARFRIAVESALNAVVMVDAQGCIALVNAETERLFGYRREELIGRPVDMLVPERFRRGHPGHRAAFMEHPQARSMGAGRELYGLHKDGGEFPVEIGLRPLKMPEGTFVLSAITDISERKQAEERFRLAVESSPNAMIMADQKGTIMLVNAETERLFGFHREEMIGHSIEMIVPERFRGHHPYLRSNFLARPVSRAMGAGRDLYGLRKDGTEVPVEIGLNPIDTPSGTLVLSAIVDITERKQAEERFRMAVDSSPNAMVMADGAGVIVLVNAETERLFGYRRGELIGKSIDVLVPPRFREHHGQLRHGFMADPEARPRGKGRDLYGLRKDGSEVPVEIGLNPIRTPQGTFVLSAIVDITERKQAEEEVARQARALARSNRQLEQFAYVASHDLQEPLRMVASYTRLLAQRYGDRLDDDARTYIRFAEEGALRMQRLIQGLLAYSRVDTRGGDPKAVKVGDALDHTLENLRLLIEEQQAEIVRGDLPVIQADQSQLAEVLQNLVGNAIKFRGEHPPRVEITAERSGAEWVFSVRDNGIGIDPQYFDRIFEVFQRLHTADEYPGTGIGLAICKRIVERLGGRMWVESAPGEGTAFLFTAPVHDGSRPEAV